MWQRREGSYEHTLHREAVGTRSSDRGMPGSGEYIPNSGFAARTANWSGDGILMTDS